MPQDRQPMDVDVPLVEEATEILRTGLKILDAELTVNQKSVVEHLVSGGKDVLYIDQTGAGKSESYFVATKLLRQRDGAGPVIVVMPLVALIEDQVRRAKEFGLAARGYTSKLRKAGKSEVICDSCCPFWTTFLITFVDFNFVLFACFADSHHVASKHVGFADDHCRDALSNFE